MPHQTYPGNVANLFVRYILTQIGADAGGFTADNWQATLDYFGNCCAYTGQPLPAPGSYDKDHAVPLNRSYGGLHVYGNVVPALQEANSQKAGLRYDEFLNAEPGRFPSLDHLSRDERQGRIAFINTFMRQAQPNGLLDAHPVMVAFYKAKYEEVKSMVEAAVGTARALLQALQVPVADEAPDVDETTLIIPDEAQLELEEQATGSLSTAYARLFEQHRDARIGAFAQAVFAQLFADDQIAPYLDKLQNPDYSRQQLGLYHPALVHQRNATNSSKYYADPYCTPDGTDYYLCNDWYRSRRGTFEDWLTGTVFGPTPSA